MHDLTNHLLHQSIVLSSSKIWISFGHNPSHESRGLVFGEEISSTEIDRRFCRLLVSPLPQLASFLHFQLASCTCSISIKRASKRHDEVSGRHFCNFPRPPPLRHPSAGRLLRWQQLQKQPAAEPPCSKAASLAGTCSPR